MEKGNADRNHYSEYDIMKFFLILFVIWGHVAIQETGDSYGGYYFDTIISASGLSDSTIHWLFLNIGFIFTSFHMKAFMALSGMLFLHSMRNGSSSRQSLPAFTVSKCKRLLLPYIVVNTLYLLPIRCFTGYYEGKNIAISYLQGQLLMHGNNYLWYLVSLFFIYIATYVLIKYTGGNHLIILATYLTLYLFRGVFPYLCYPFAECSIWFYIGYLVAADRDIFIPAINRYKFLILPFSFGGLILSRLAVIHGAANEEGFYFLTGFLGILGMYSLSVCLSNYGCIRRMRFIQYVSRNALGIYIYSDPVNGLLNYLALTCLGATVFSNNLLSLLLICTKFACNIIVPALIISLMKKCHLRYLY